MSSGFILVALKKWQDPSLGTAKRFCPYEKIYNDKEPESQGSCKVGNVHLFCVAWQQHDDLNTLLIIVMTGNIPTNNFHTSALSLPSLLHLFSLRCYKWTKPNLNLAPLWLLSILNYCENRSFYIWLGCGGAINDCGWNHRAHFWIFFVWKLIPTKNDRILISDPSSLCELNRAKWQVIKYLTNEKQ